MKSKPHILIAGGGIGGLAAALALLLRGFDVDVYEQAAELKEVGAGIQISPNGNRALDSLGVCDRLSAMSSHPEAKNVRLWNTGRTWDAFDLGTEAVRRFGYPYLTVYRPDLLQVLVDGVRAIKPDAVHLDRRAAGFRQRGGSVVLQFADGTEAGGDALIGADGVHSQIRSQLWGATMAKFTGMVAWRGVIPMERLPENHRGPIASAWVGPRGHILHYPLRGGRVLNFVATIEREDWQTESWSAQGTAEECARDFAGWHEDIQVKIRAAPTLFKWALMGREALDRWTQGNVSLLGDACHPTLPLLAQGAVMAIEDAVILGRCFEKYDTVNVALEAYEAVRRPVTKKKVDGALDNLKRFHSPLYEAEETAGPYIEREWGREAIVNRYDWIYSDDITRTPI